MYFFQSHDLCPSMEDDRQTLVPRQSHGNKHQASAQGKEQRDEGRRGLGRCRGRQKRKENAGDQNDPSPHLLPPCQMAIHEAQVVPGRSDVGVGVGQVGHGGGWGSVVGFFGLTKINVVDGGGGGVGQDGLACRSKFLLECVYFSPQLMLFFFGAQFLSGKILGQQCGQFGVHGWLVWVVGAEKGCLGVLELGNGERMVRRVGFAGGGEGWKWWLEEWFGMVCVKGIGV
jgi:hypothetical protein